MSVYQVVGRNIARRRKALKLTQEKLGELAQLSQKAIAQIENARVVPRQSNLEQISKVLGCTIDDLFEEPKPETVWTEPTAKELHAIVGNLLTENEELKARIAELEADNKRVRKMLSEANLSIADDAVQSVQHILDRNQTTVSSSSSKSTKKSGAGSKS